MRGSSEKRYRFPNPKFGISTIRISNVGAIDDIFLDFTSSALTAIYAGNGVGKTTILECMSMLGHLPCLPFLKVGSVEPNKSGLTTHFGELQSETDRNYNSFDFGLLTKLGLRTWLDAVRPGKNASWGCIEFEVFDTLPGGGTALHSFAIIIESAPLGIQGSPKLTKLLSRGEFDNLVTTDLRFSDDRVLGLSCFIVYDPQKQVGQRFESLIAKLAKGRTFIIISSDADRTAVNQIQHRTLPVDDAIEARSVSYINTDLNDFGRGNDLRESPKDLRRDFGKEIMIVFASKLISRVVLCIWKNLPESAEEFLKLRTSTSPTARQSLHHLA